MPTDVSTIETPRISLPALGFGTFELTPDDAYTGVSAALEAGYRHIDTAQMYRNEEAVGRAIADSPVDRDEVFLTTKVPPDEAAPADVERSHQESLQRLGVDHVDLLLLHWPSEHVAPLEATMEAFTDLREREMTRHIGVSNFPSAMLQRAFDLAPIVNDQVEHHPYLSVDRIIEVLDSNGGFLTAYSPLAKGAVLDDPVLTEIGEVHGVGPVQVTVRWLLQRGVCAIPRTSKPERVVSNADVFGFELTAEEMARIDGLRRGQRLVDPASLAVPWDDE